MALANNQLLMLDILIYSDYCENDKTVGQIVERIKDGLNNGEISGCGNMSADDLRGVIASIERDSNLCSYTVKNYENDPSTGERVACFLDDPDQPKDVNVVFRGSVLSDEWHDNGEGGYKADTDHQLRAKEYVDKLPAEYGSNMTVTGHSKGGNKAQYVTITTDRFSRCVSIDGQGFSEEFLEKYSDEIATKKDRIESISAANDLVNSLLYPIAGIRTYILTEDQGLDFNGYHKLSILLDENGNLRSETEQSPLAQIVNEYTRYIISNVPEPKRSIAINGLLAVMEDGGDKESIIQTIYGGYTAVSYLDNFAFDQFVRQVFGTKGGVFLTRDFSDASKQKMLSLVTQVENEKWGDFTDWVGDRWYDFESWIGTLDIKRYINNVNTYHKKVIDKNNATEESINKIFDAVHNVDASYSTTFDNISSNLSEWRRFIQNLTSIVEPGQGNFNSKYISRTLNNVLSNISKANIQRVRDTLVQVVDGEQLFDMDLILDYIKKDPAQMTADEKQAVLGVIAELKDTVAFYESACTLGDDALGAAFWNRAGWVADTTKYDSFSAICAHYNDLYMSVLTGCIEQGEDSNTFAAALMKISNGEDALSLLGIDASVEVGKIFGSASLTAYVAKWKTEHSEQYFGKLTVSGSVGDSSAGSNNKIKSFNDWAEKKLKENDLLKEDKAPTEYIDTRDPETAAKDGLPTFYNKKLTLGEADLIGGNASVSIYDGSFDVGENGKIGVTVGEAEAHASIKAGFYVIGADGKKNKFSPGIQAEVGASVTAVEANWEQQWLGDENLGLNTDVGVTVGKASAQADVGAQVFGEDGKLNVQLGASASAEAIAAEVEGSVGVNVLGGEVGVKGTLNVGVGAHADVGYRDGVFKIDVGASIGVGASLKLEVDVGGMVDGVCDAAEAVGDFAKDAWDGVKDGWNKLWSW